MRATSDQEATVVDTDGRRVPTFGEELQIRVLEDGATFARRRLAGLEQPDSLITRLDSGIIVEATLISTNACLNTKLVTAYETIIVVYLPSSHY